MDSRNDGQLRQFKWHIVIISVVLGGVLLLALSTKIFENTAAFRDSVFLLGSLIFLAALLAVLARTTGIVNTLRDNSIKMEEAARALENIRDGLMQINQSTRVSDTVKAIAFREDDRQSLRNAVFERLKQNDLDGAYEIIDEITTHAGYRVFADELRREADKYRNATEEERIEQSIGHIEVLFKACQWPRASIQIEALIGAHPHSDKARAMRQQLIDRKDERKKILLAAWDDAVQQQDTDRSLEILKDLDMYLTANEGLALQEAAKDVFRTKLHNLGVQFSIAVSDRQWETALDVGQQIVRDFPNSRMAEEIRTKLDVLRQNVQMQSV